MLKFETTTETDRTCDTCHSAESTVYCRADSAYLCNACDIHIHSANPLARRHHRIPISQVSYTPSAAEINGFLFGPEEDDNATSFCGDVDEYLDLNDYHSSCLFHDDHKHYGTNDSVVPIEYKYNNHSLSQTVSFNEVSVSSMDVGVVPESTVPVEIATQLTPLEREARVLRYREKKKMRKFEKTIRYASRKAYAETRPRIKGRFAKRTELEGEVDQMFASSVLAENAYGVVPNVLSCRF